MCMEASWLLHVDRYRVNVTHKLCFLSFLSLFKVLIVSFLCDFDIYEDF